jgi:outer membrane receptor protein involved in Fe transport
MAQHGCFPKFYVLLLVTLVLSLCIPSFAQFENATLSGTITDPSGATVPGAQVKLTNVNTGITATVPSNESGLYVFTNVHPGPYRVVVEKTGFRQVVLTDLTLNVQDVLSRNFKLQLGVVGESVTVTGGIETVNTVSAAVSTVVDNQFVENMPLNGRSFQSLIYLTPGVTIMPAAQDAPGQFSVNGQRTDTNYFTIDGVSANFGTTPSVLLGQTVGGAVPGMTIGGGTNGLVSVDAMQEFRVQTSTYAPEFGRSPGAQISIVTKSGANQFHGTAFDYLRNDLFDARNWFDAPPLPKPPLRQNDFGGTLGGPIIKDKTFFFFSYEGNRMRQPRTGVGNFLTPAARTVCQGPPPYTSPCVASVFKPLVDAFPIPTGPVNPDGITAPLTAAYSDPSRLDSISLRIDHSLTKKITLFARYNHAPSTDGWNWWAMRENDIANTDTATAGATVTFSPNKMNDFRANWSRSTGKATDKMESRFGAVAPPDSVLFPSFANANNSQAQFQTFFTDGWVEAGARTNNVQRQLNFLDTFSTTVGVHQLKFGVDYRRMKPTNSQLNYSWFAFAFSDSDLQAGTFPFLGVSAAAPITATMNNYSLFGQDTWKATNHLTLTYGLRWEINTPPVSTTAGKPLYAIQGIFDSNPLGVAPADTPLWKTTLGNFAPRIGVAYQLTPKTVVRGGFGLFYDLGYGGGTGTFSYEFPYTRQTYIYGSIPFDFTNPAFQPLPVTTTIAGTDIVNVADPHLRLPVTYQWNAAVERELGAKQSLTMTYVGANGQRLLRQDTIVPAGSVFADPNTGGGKALATRNAGYSHYNALQLQFLRRMTRGLQALVSYNLAKSSDLGSSDLSGAYAPSVSQVVLPGLTPSDFDVRHSFSAAVSYELPAPAWGKVGHAVVKGWALDGVVRASSARPFNVIYELYGYANGNGTYVTQADVVPGQPFWIPAPGQPRGEVLNPDAFAKPSGPYGNFPRNGLRGFPISQTDLALRRRLNLTERVKLDVRAEYFNVFNHPMFGDPNNIRGYGDYLSPYFGQVRTLNISLGGGDLGQGQNALYAPGGPRSAQFTLRLTF